MTRNNYILEELKSLQAHKLIQIDVLPYHLPADYWRELDIWSEGVSAAEDAATSFIAKDLPYSVPAHYFNTLSDQMLTLLKGEALHTARIDTPYEVEPLYFEQNAQKWEQLIAGNLTAQEELNLLGNLSLAQDNPYAVPQHYFRDLADEVVAQVLYSEEAELEDAPLLASLKGANPFETPDFDTNKTIEATTQEAENAPNVVTFQPKKSAPIWKKIVGGVAAVFVIGLGINAFDSAPDAAVEVAGIAALNTDHSAKADSMLNALSDESIANYIAMNNEEFAYTYQFMALDEMLFEEKVDEIFNEIDDEALEDAIKYL